MKWTVPLLACLALAGCSDPPPTPEADPPEPQVAESTSGQHTELREAIQEPIDKARAVEDTQADRNAERDQALEDAGG